MPLGFPLLRAPQTVQTQILNIFKPQEILILSMCSKRAYNLAKVHRKKPEKGRLSIANFGTSCVIHYNVLIPPTDFSINNRIPSNRLIRCLHISEMLDNTEIIKIGDTKVPAKFDTDGLLTTYWQDPIQGMKIVIDYATRLFNMCIQRLAIITSSLWLIDWINSRQESFKSALLLANERAMTDEEYRHVLTNCRATDRLSILAAAPKNFCFTGNFQKHDFFQILNSRWERRWVTLENLKSIDAVNILLGHSKLTSFDVNLFLKYWLTGGSPRFRYLLLVIRELRFNEIFQSLLEAVTQVPERREFQLLSGEMKHFDHAYDIQRADGAKISVLLDDGHLCLFVWPATENV